MDNQSQRSFAGRTTVNKVVQARWKGNSILPTSHSQILYRYAVICFECLKEFMTSSRGERAETLEMIRATVKVFVIKKSLDLGRVAI
jgi:hypothetical protein